jgi:Activator of Hsp90 ATPase homolog 1-like protein
MSRMILKTEGDTHVVVTRRFAASPEAVYRAHTEPALIQKWLLGPDGWTMPVCVSEPRPGGKIDMNGRTAKGERFTRPASIWSWRRSGGSFTWRECTCRIRRRTIMWKRVSNRTETAR